MIFWFSDITSGFIKKVPQLPVCTRDRYIIIIGQLYTPSTFYMKSAVYVYVLVCSDKLIIIKAIGMLRQSRPPRIAT